MTENLMISVVIVIAVVFLGITAFLILLDLKASRLEREVEQLKTQIDTFKTT